MCAAYAESVCASQISPSQLLIEIQQQGEKDVSFTLKTDIQVQVVAVNRSYVAVSSGRHVAVYKIVGADKQGSTTVLMSFGCDTEKLLIHDAVLIILTPQVTFSSNEYLYFK